MAGYITISSRHSKRLSEKWRHTFVYATSPIFGTSLFCAGVNGVLKWPLWCPLPIEERPLPSSFFSF